MIAPGFICRSCLVKDFWGAYAGNLWSKTNAWQETSKENFDDFIMIQTDKLSKIKTSLEEA